MSKARFIIQRSNVEPGKVWVKYKARNGETFLFGENQENAEDIIEAIENMRIDIQDALIIRKDKRRKK